MRRDMFEVIIERPRLGGSGPEKRGRTTERSARALASAPQKRGMRRGKRDRKELNENLAPLRRFLLRRVGRKWDAVRSEMCEVLSMSSAVQKHVLDHVRQWVEENPVFIGGLPHRAAALGKRYMPLRSHPKWPGFYVCPRTGALRVAAWEPRRKRG